MPGTFNSLITRTDASPLIPTDQAAQIIQALPQQSVALSLFRQVNMGTKITTLPVLDSLGQAYWVNGDTGLKQTTDVSWVGVDLVAEEIAAIVPVPDGHGGHVGFAVGGGPAVARRADRRGHRRRSVCRSQQAPVVADRAHPSRDRSREFHPRRFDPGERRDRDRHGRGVRRRRVRRLRRERRCRRTFAAGDAARDTTGQKLLDVSAGTIEGVPISWVGAGAFGANDLAVVGDYSMAVLGIRQDITFKVLDQAVLTDDTGAVIINLPQQDSQALRVVMRVAFAAANPITPEQANDAQRFPFAVLAKGS